MKMFYSLFVSLLICCNVFGNAVNRRVIRQSENNSCTTPDGQTGTCIRLKNCTYMQDILKTQRAQEPEVKTFLQKSQCGKDADTTPKVCCILDAENPPLIPPVAPSGEWPWIVALGYERTSSNTITWNCGGSLIADRWVVTAAHCIPSSSSNFTLTTARIGDLNLDDRVNDEASPVDIKVNRIITHPYYTPRPVTNDVALLRLQDPVTFTENIRPICIPKGDKYKSEEFYMNKSLRIAGWGHTQGFEQSKETRSDALLQAEIYPIETQLCDQKYRTRGARAVIDDRVLCAMRPGVDACQGDSGGPMIIPIGSSYNLAGIVSFGIGCANENFPGVYTRVAYFGDWIRNTTELKL